MQLSSLQMTCGYGAQAVVTDVSIQLAPAEIHCLLGPNGSGKSTLLKTLLGLQPTLAGSVLLEGRELSAWSRKELARLIAYVPQAHLSVFAYKARDIVLMGRAPHISHWNNPGRKDQDAVDEVMSALKVGYLADRSYATLSGGERQLILIARALAQKPAFLLLDEPTASLDLGNQMLVLREIKRLAQSGLGILMTTHSPNQAFFCQAQAIVLKHGRVAVQGPAESVLNGDLLSNVYSIPIRVLRLEEDPPMLLSVPFWTEAAMPAATLQLTLSNVLDPQASARLSGG